MLGEQGLLDQLPLADPELQVQSPWTRCRRRRRRGRGRGRREKPGRCGEAARQGRGGGHMWEGEKGRGGG